MGEAIIDNDGVACVATDRCPVCGTTGRKRHEKLRDMLFGAPGEWAIRTCDNGGCGVGWIDPQPLPDQIGKLYQSYYTHVEDTPDATWQPEFSDKGSAKARVKAVLARLMPWRRPQFVTGLLHLEDLPPGRLLEVGCGAGQFLREAQAAGWNAHGIDFDENAVAAANSIPGVTARATDIAGAGYPAAHFDAIVMNNVFEHLLEPDSVLQEIKRLLKPGGRFVAVTPNFQSAGHRIYGPDWRGLEIPRHLILYTPRALKMLAKAAGFAKVHAFSPLVNGMPFMAELSTEIAHKSGRTPRRAHPAVGKVASLLALFGVNRTEFAVLVAEK